MKDAAKEILGALEKHESFLSECYEVDRVKSFVNSELYRNELKEEFGIDLGRHVRPDRDWFRIDENRFMGLFGERYSRTISYPDNGDQPDSETLYFINFPTGAYFLGSDYPSGLFQRFLRELEESIHTQE